MVYVEIDFNTCEYCGHELESDDMFNSWLCDCYCDCRLLKEDCEGCNEDAKNEKTDDLPKQYERGKASV